MTREGNISHPSLCLEPALWGSGVEGEQVMSVGLSSEGGMSP